MPEFTNPNDFIQVANDAWRDDSIEDIDFTDQVQDGSNLQPGERMTAVEIETTTPGEFVAVRDVATTPHAADIDGDGTPESIVQYIFDAKIRSASDTYHSLPGLTTTLPLGQIGTPIELLSGSFIGPMKSFRIRFFNRSGDFSSPQTVNIDDIAAEVHARRLREDATSEIDGYSDPEEFRNLTPVGSLDYEVYDEPGSDY